MPALATEGLAWTWADTESRQYSMTAEVRLPQGLQLLAEQNHMTRISEFRIDVVTTCALDGVPAKTFRLNCSIDDLRLLARAIPGDEKMLAPIVGSWDERMSAGTVQLELAPDGKVRSIDLEGLSKDNDRQRAIQETARLLLVRAFAAFDLNLPKKGDDKGKGTWKQKSSMAMQLPTTQGNMGSISVQHQLADGAITTTGRGVMGAGEMIQVGAETRPANMYDLEWHGEASFDTAAGTLTRHIYTVYGKATPSSLVAENGEVEYRQVIRLERVAAGAVLEPLGPSGPLP